MPIDASPLDDEQVSVVSKMLFALSLSAFAVWQSHSYRIALGALLTLTAAAARVYMDESHELRNRNKNQVERLLEMQNIPLRDDNQVSILNAALLLGRGDDTPDPPPRNEMLETRLHNAVSSFGRQIETGTEAETIRNALRTTIDILYPPGTETLTQKGRSELETRAFEVLGDGAELPILEYCRVSPKHESHGQSYGDPLCSEHDNGRRLGQVVVPSRVALSCVSRNASGITFDPSVNETCKRLDHAGRLSHALDVVISPAIQAHLRRAPSEGEPSERLVQAYFLSPESLLRVWAEDGAKAHNKFGPQRLWGGNAFVAYALRGADGDETGDVGSARSSANAQLRNVTNRPYVDVGGNGLVKSRCTSLLEVSGEADPNGLDGRPRLLGVFCTDRTVPLLTGKTDHGLFRYEVLVIDPNADPTVRTRLEHDHTYQMSAHSREQAFREIGRMIETESIQGFTRTVRLSLGKEDKAYLVPLSRTPGVQNEMNALLIQPVSPEHPIGSLIVAVAGSILSLFIVVLRAITARSSERLQREEATLRNLQVGVMRFRGRSSMIEGANDRAEEILGIPLPTFGSTDDPVPRLTMAEIFHEKVMRQKSVRESVPPTELQVVDDLGDLAPETLGAIERQRSVGSASSYFARLRRNNQVVRIDGAPMVDSMGGRKGPTTFGVVRRIPLEWNTRIDKKIVTDKPDNERSRPAEAQEGEEQ